MADDNGGGDGGLVRCAALGCSNNSNDDLAFFLMPMEPKLKTQWETNIGRNDLPPSSAVCEAHFSPNDIVNEDEGMTLKYDAVPSMFGGKSGDENDALRRSARKRTPKKTGSGVLPTKKIRTRRILPNLEEVGQTEPLSEKKGRKKVDGSPIASNKPEAGNKSSPERLRKPNRKKNNSESDSESIIERSTNPTPESGSGVRRKQNRRKKPTSRDSPVQVESAPVRPKLIALNGTDERGHAIAEWYLLDVFEATKMVSSVLKTGAVITDTLVANVEETIIDVISKLLQRVSSVIITTLEDEFGFQSDIKKILSSLGENIHEDVGKLKEFEQKENEVPEASHDMKEQNYTSMLRAMDPSVKNIKEQQVYEEVISPVDGEYSVLIEHSYFREERLPKGKKALRENRSSEILQCGFCKFKTKIKSRLRRHMRKHLTNKVYYCPRCEYMTRSEESLQKHYRTHSGSKPFACTECSFKTANRSNLTRHMLIHRGEKPFQCPYCSHATRQKVSLESHMKCHDAVSSKEPSIYVCGECSFVTINKPEFNTHVRKHKVYNCAHCDYSTKIHKELKEHQIEHKGLEHECKECEKIFPSAEELRVHLETHEVPIEFICDVCAYKTDKFSYFNRHMACHSVIRPFKCEYCFQTFRMNSHLMAHVRRHEIGPYCKKSSMFKGT